MKILIEKYGKQKLNSLTKYPSILTYHKLGEKGRLLDELTYQDSSDLRFATEKIDGTNTRIILYHDDAVIGSRENLLHMVGDIFFDPTLEIVETILDQVDFGIIERNPGVMTVIYGEVYGGKLQGKQYGTDKMGFRVFDVAEIIDPRKILELPIEQISLWREKERDGIIQYGQKFLNVRDLNRFCRNNSLYQVPVVNLKTFETDHACVLSALRCDLPTSLSKLSDSGNGISEGVVVRNADRSKIVKIRFEDYERTLKTQK